MVRCCTARYSCTRDGLAETLEEGPRAYPGIRHWATRAQFGVAHRYPACEVSESADLGRCRDLLLLVLPFDGTGHHIQVRNRSAPHRTGPPSSIYLTLISDCTQPTPTSVLSTPTCASPFGPDCTELDGGSELLRTGLDDDAQVLGLLVQHCIHRVYIVDEQEVAVGIVTCTDILRKVVEVATAAAPPSPANSEHRQQWHHQHHQRHLSGDDAEGPLKPKA
jgi:hypothetical protein